MLTADIKEKGQKLLEKGQTASEIGRKLNIKSSTIRKAIKRVEEKKRGGRRTAAGTGQKQE